MEKRDYNFDAMGPYEGKDFEQAIERLRNYPQLINNFTDIISRHSRVVNKWKSFHAKNMLTHSLEHVSNVEEFQKQITSDIFLAMIESSSIDQFTFDGIDKLEDRPYIYLSNHRDIVLDTALLDLALYRSDRVLCEMVVGDNLVGNQFIEDMFRVNGGVVIRRTLSSATELREETLKMSAYVRHCIMDKKKSLWIAQKSGRSKDGIDNTNPAVIKMLYLYCREQKIDFKTFLETTPIVPVAISYQFDPCDVTKSQAEIRKLKAEGCYNVYKKKKYEDIIDLVKGLRCWKGNVHIQVGDPLDSSSIKDPNEAALECDRQIHRNFRLWDTNYYCWDKLNDSTRYEEFYKDLNTKAFDKKYHGFNPQVVHNVYLQYANPVTSMLNEEKADN